MKGIIWNSNGFRDPKKHHFFEDITREQNLAFMAILETGRSSFTDPFLKNLCAEKNFLWHNKDPQGRSGGILVGIELDVFDIGAIDEGDFYVKFHLCNKENNFKWVLVAVYGPAQIPLKEQFLTELVQMISHERLPVLVGGDFNILRHADEKTRIILINSGLFFLIV
jgi:hypothetical protein